MAFSNFTKSLGNRQKRLKFLNKNLLFQCFLQFCSWPLKILKYCWVFEILEQSLPGLAWRFLGLCRFRLRQSPVLRHLLLLLAKLTKILFRWKFTNLLCDKSKKPHQYCGKSFAQLIWMIPGQPCPKFTTLFSRHSNEASLIEIQRLLSRYDRK